MQRRPAALTQREYDLLIIGSFFSLLPVLILFLLFQRFFVAGMTAGALKG